MRGGYGMGGGMGGGYMGNGAQISNLSNGRRQQPTAAAHACAPGGGADYYSNAEYHRQRRRSYGRGGGMGGGMGGGYGMGGGGYGYSDSRW